MIVSLLAIVLASPALPKACEPPVARDVAALTELSKKSGAVSVGLDSIATWCFDSGGAWTGGHKLKKGQQPDPEAIPSGDCAKAIGACEGAKVVLTADLRALLYDTLADIETPYLGLKYTPKRSGLAERPPEIADCRSKNRSELFAQAQARMDIARLANQAQSEYRNFRTWLYKQSLTCAQMVARGETDLTRRGIAVDTPVEKSGGTMQVDAGLPAAPAGVVVTRDAPAGAGGGTRSPDGSNSGGTAGGVGGIAAGAPGAGASSGTTGSGASAGGAVGPAGVGTTGAGAGAAGVGKPGVGATGAGAGVAGVGTPGVGATGAGVAGTGTPGVGATGAGAGVAGAGTPGVGATGAGAGVAGAGTPGVGATGAGVAGASAAGGAAGSGGPTGMSAGGKGAAGSTGGTSPGAGTPGVAAGTPQSATGAGASAGAGTTGPTRPAAGAGAAGGAGAVASTGGAGAGGAGVGTVGSPRGGVAAAGAQGSAAAGTTGAGAGGVATKDLPLGGPTVERQKALASSMIVKWRYLAEQRARIEPDPDWVLGFLASRELRDCKCQRVEPKDIVARLEAGDRVAALQADDDKNTKCELCLQDAFPPWKIRVQKQCMQMDDLTDYELGVLQRSDDGNGLPPRCFEASRVRRAARPPAKGQGTTASAGATAQGKGGSAFIITKNPDPPAATPVAQGSGAERPTDYAPIPPREDGHVYYRVFMSRACEAEVEPGPITARTGDLMPVPPGAAALIVKSPCGGLVEVYFGREEKPRVTEVFAKNQPLRLQFRKP
ncbi:MAG: hypothetical protein AB1938_06785 [Myxococcota bacterium]